MNGKRLSIEDLERLPIGTMVTVKRGYFNLDYLTYRCGEKLCLISSKPDLGILYYEDILKLEIYECARQKPLKYMPYILTSNSDLAKKMLDDWSNISWDITSINPIYNECFDKPQMRITREFNIAKKKELDIKPLNGDEKHKLNKARLEFLVDIALEENNAEDFIKFSGKLKKYYSKEARV